MCPLRHAHMWIKINNFWKVHTDQKYFKGNKIKLINVRVKSLSIGVRNWYFRKNRHIPTMIPIHAPCLNPRLDKMVYYALWWLWVQGHLTFLLSCWWNSSDHSGCLWAMSVDHIVLGLIKEKDCSLEVNPLIQMASCCLIGGKLTYWLGFSIYQSFWQLWSLEEGKLLLHGKWFFCSPCSSLVYSGAKMAQTQVISWERVLMEDLRIETDNRLAPKPGYK